MKIFPPVESCTLTARSFLILVSDQYEARWSGLCFSLAYTSDVDGASVGSVYLWWTTREKANCSMQQSRACSHGEILLIPAGAEDDATHTPRTG